MKKKALPILMAAVIAAGALNACAAGSAAISVICEFKRLDAFFAI